MTPAALVLGLLAIALVGLYASRPRYRRRVLSAWRFLVESPDPPRGRPAIALSRPHLTAAFWMQLGVLLLALAAVLLPGLERAGGAADRLGVWLLVDTSYSMTTRDGEGSRFDRARREAGRIVARTFEADGADPCLRLSAFDLDRRDLIAARSLGPASAALARLEVRPAGTDLGAVRRAMAAPAMPALAVPGCDITHVVVISDRPAPDLPLAGVSDREGRRLIWRDVGRPAGNFGIATVAAARDPFSGRVAAVTVRAAAWGGIAGPPALTVRGPDGGSVATEALGEGEGRPPWTARFVPAGPGDHVATLAPGGAFAGDDRAVISVPAAGPLQVDWRLPDRRLPARLDWRLAGPREAALRVVGDEASAELAQQPGPPVLVVGSGYEPGRSTPVGLFAPAHPVRAFIDFDLLERAGPDPAALPAGWTTVVGGARGGSWIAVRERPRAVRIPGLPQGGGTPVDRLSTILFFNAVRWLLADSPPALHVEWTTPAGIAIPQAIEESDTGGTPRSRGRIDDIVPISMPASDGAAEAEPLWPWLLLGAALLFAVERSLAWRQVAAP